MVLTISEGGALSQLGFFGVWQAHLAGSHVKTILLPLCSL